MYYAFVFCCLFSIAVSPLSSVSAELKAEAPGGWAATYGGVEGNWAYSVQQTTDGGYIVAGETGSFGAGENDVWVLKLRPDGTVEWQKTYGGVKDDGACSICQISDGGYVVAGWTESFGAGKTDAWVLKLRPDGTVEWQKTYGGAKKDIAYCIQQTSDGGYIVVGRTSSFSINRRGNAWVLKLRPDGTVEWQKTYGGNVWPYSAVYIQQTKDGGYIMAGWTSSFSAGLDDLWALKLRADGTVEWQKTYGGSGTEVASCIQPTSEGGYIVTGRTTSFGAGPYDIWVLKLRADGTVEWQKTYGGIYWDEPHYIQQTVDGGYVVAGWTSHGLGFYARESRPDIFKMKFWVLKLKADGSVEWQKTYERRDFNRLHSAQQTRDGGYIVAGDTKSLSKDFDILVLKLRPDGSIDPSCEFVEETNISGQDSDAIVKDTTVYPVNSDANPQDSSATVQDTNASVEILCPPTTAKP